MSWQNEMGIIVRHLINDLDSSSYTFTNDRVEEAILVSAQLVSLEVDFEQTYTIEVDGSSLSPDPTASSNKDDSFINLVCLRTGCLLLGSEVKTNALSAMAIKDGPSSIDTRGIVANLHILHGGMCEKYEDAKMQYKLNGVVGQAVLGPYSPGSDAVARANMTNRSGWFE
ncbi:hypothetical protein CL634_00055 [bacterium]|nr:hypothetical protein [bacterium]|tara:strand:- start:1778 stop:2287 length:510 start_codon:yes stop_codon:yes gene_type:complete